MIIKCQMSNAELSSAISQVYKYKRDLLQKVERFRQRVAYEIAGLARESFSNAIVDDYLKGVARRANVSVTIENHSNVSVVVASGKDAIFLEFGAGVHHNGSVGTSPHPLGVKFGFTIGSYGKGKGKQDSWGFLDEHGEFHITHGTPAAMPMWQATQEIVNRLTKIAREVFT